MHHELKYSGTMKENYSLLDLATWLKDRIFHREGAFPTNKKINMAEIPKLSLRQKSLLAFLGADGGGALDPVRIMKGMFVFCQEAPAVWFPKNQRYRFKPYHYGPFAQDVYIDLEKLAQQELLQFEDVPGRSWQCYSLTPKGELALSTFEKHLGGDVITYLKNIREWMSALSFQQLLSSVYKKYPEFAKATIFNG